MKIYLILLTLYFILEYLAKLFLIFLLFRCVCISFVIVKLFVFKFFKLKEVNLDLSAPNNSVLKKLFHFMPLHFLTKLFYFLQFPRKIHYLLLFSSNPLNSYSRCQFLEISFHYSFHLLLFSRRNMAGSFVLKRFYEYV